MKIKTVEKYLWLWQSAGMARCPATTPRASQCSTGLPTCVQSAFRTGVFACVALLMIPSALATVQFDALRRDTFILSGDTVQEWRAVKSGAALTPLHGSSNGWETAVRLAPYGEKAAVSFTDSNGNAVPSPMTFGEDDDTPVSTVFAVIKCTTPAQLSTLIDAPTVDIRLTAKPTVLPSFKFSEEQLGYTATYRVNGTATASLTPSSSYQLVEVLFSSPLELSDIFVGGSVAVPSWKRNWRGEIAELLFLPSPPSPQERNAVHHYVSRKWGVAVPYTPNYASPALLSALGVSTGDIFSTVIIVR